MRSYTNVIFDHYEIQLLRTASLHLDVAYPQVRTAMPKKREERHPDHEARVVYQLIRDTTQGSHDAVTQALRVMKRLEEVLMREGEMTYWLDTTEQDSGSRPERSDAPTSGYRQLRMLSELRQDQLRDVRRALTVLAQAAGITTPARTHDLASIDG